MSGYTRRTITPTTDSEMVAILSVDPVSNKATGLTRRESHVEIDLSYHVGSVQVTPSRGEQWYIRRPAGPTPTNGISWVLDSKIPFNTPEITLPATEGQHQIGSGKGPVQLHGTVVNANGPLRLANPSSSLVEAIARARSGNTRGAGSLPDAADIENGALAFDGSSPVYTKDGQWVGLGTYSAPAGGIPLTDLASSVQSTLNSAYQLPAGGIPSTSLATGVQNSLNLANTALQDIPDNSVGLDALIASGGAGYLSNIGGTLQWSSVGSSTDLQAYFDELTGLTGASAHDAVVTFVHALGTVAGDTLLTAIPDALAAINNRLQYLNPNNGLINSQALDNIAASILRNLNNLGEFDASKLFNISNIPAILQSSVDGLEYTISQLATLVDFNQVAMFLFGTTDIAGLVDPVLQLAVLPLDIPISFIAGLSDALLGFLGVSDWNTFLAQANLAIGTAGSDVGHLVLGLGDKLQHLDITTGLYNAASGFTNQASSILRNLGVTGLFDASALTNIANIPALAQSSVTGLVSALGNLLPLGTWNSFVNDANIALGTAGSDLTHLISGLNIVAGNAGGIPLLLSGIGVDTVPELSAWLASVNATASTNWNNIQTMLTNTGNATVAELAGMWNSALTNLSALNAGNLFGQIGSGLMGLIPASHVAVTSPNLQSDGSFDTAASVAGAGGVFFWDSVHDHTGNGGGSVSVMADGLLHQLLGDLVQVAPNQQIDVSGWARWSALSYAPGTNPICLRLTTYADLAGSNVAGVVTMAQDTSGLSSSDWRGPLTGSWTVPGSGVQSVRLTCALTADATAGQAWFDDLSITKTGLVPQTAVNGLLGTLQEDLVGITSWVQSGIDDLNTTISAQISAINNALTGAINAGIHDVQTWVQGLLNELSPLNALNLVNAVPLPQLPDVQTILNNLYTGFTGLFAPFTGLFGLGAAAMPGGPDTPITHDDVLLALAEKTNIITGLSAQVARLEQQLSSGVAVRDEFQYVTTAGLSGDWAVTTLSGTGSTHADGDQVLFDIDGNSGATVFHRWVGTPAHTSTDYQQHTIILGSQGEDSTDESIASTSWDTIYARVSNDGLNYLRLSFAARSEANNVQLWYAVGGTESLLWQGEYGFIPGPGSALTLLAGVKGDNPRKHRILINGAKLQDVTESSPVTQLGEANRGGAFGMTAGINFLTGGMYQAAAPGNVHQWSMQDQ